MHFSSESELHDAFPLRFLSMQIMQGFPHSHPLKTLDCEENGGNPASCTRLTNSGENAKRAGMPRNKPKGRTSGAVIYHHPYQRLLWSSCQHG